MAGPYRIKQSYDEDIAYYNYDSWCGIQFFSLLINLPVLADFAVITILCIHLGHDNTIFLLALTRFQNDLLVIFPT